ncbi:putative porin [Hoylesella loescheii]|uniref:Outer membrane insertion signal domain protein n=1 Tax=Hoylesella loescheii DSM 19665 = JCM 12249 = ATCC 15930 TaxID=1122985 RepID=A0A069QLX7_HOYLO|nr:putative porin [Hoylesella loescheii]KDR53790.1 hypothetical protein HMPREF1991_00157 [Hoylesella loescheii DSM 19665 = JCM 12249 = ATCC 15930]
MNRLFMLVAMLSLAMSPALAQDDFTRLDENGNFSTGKTENKKDSLGSNKEIPKGLKVWTVDTRFGDRIAAQPDTLSHMFMNKAFTYGLRGEYNMLGNLSSPRLNRVFVDRPAEGQFLFTQPYSYFIVPVDKFHFTNTLSPITNLSYFSCGDKTDGEDYFTALFGVNAGKRVGIGLKFDYDYGRGFYKNQSTAMFNYTMYGSYLGDRYQAHLLFSTNHQKATENGGITNDNYITHPETFNENYSTNEIPTVLAKNWNRNDNLNIFFTHRYNIGFNRKVPMTKEEIAARKFAMEAQKDKKQREQDRNNRSGNNKGKASDNKEYTGRPDNATIAGIEPEDSAHSTRRITVSSKAQADSLMAQTTQTKKDTSWLKNEYVPVTSFVHTLNFENYKRIYEAHETPANYYANTYFNAGKLTGDSIFDETRHRRLRNTLALALLEGFNKWAKAGIKAFISSDIRHYELPNTQGRLESFNEQTMSFGGQLVKMQGKTLHYGVTAETWFLGKDAGQLKVDASADLNFPLFGDTVTLAANAFFHRINPSFYFRHFQSRHFWWDNDNLSKIIHSRLQATLSYQKTRTKLRFVVDELQNHTYFTQNYTINADYKRTGNTVSVEQSSAAINLLTAELTQDFTFGPLNWESVVTWQRTSHPDVLPLPSLNIYTNLYLRFKIARVLKCDFGADMRYFTSYNAPDYSPALGLFTVQGQTDKVKIGNYPLVNVYANFHLKQARFFILMSHINAGSGTKNYFFAPHYPLNDRMLYFGLSWNFFN